MKILVILGHPEPGSLNHAIAAVVCDCLRENGHDVVFHDLYAEEFPPSLPTEEIAELGTVPQTIQNHCSQLQTADGIIIVHPNWWGQPPAILKGWVDRVFRPGVAYQFEEGDGGEGVPIGLLKARSAVVLNTSNTPQAREILVFGDPLETLWRQCIFDLCGVKDFYRRTFDVVITSSFDQRCQWLDDAKQLVASVFPKSGQTPSP